MAEKSRSELNALIDKPFKKGNEDLATKLKAIVESAPNKVDEPSGGGGVSLGETNTTAYRGDRGKTAYDHSQAIHAPADAVAQAASYTDSEIDTLAGSVSTALSGKANSSHSHTSSDISDFNEAVDARIPSQITQQIIEGLI